MHTSVCIGDFIAISVDRSVPDKAKYSFLGQAIEQDGGGLIDFSVQNNGPERLADDDHDW